MEESRLQSSTKCCLLCQSSVIEDDSSNWKAMDLLEAQLEVIFLVRNLLDVSKDTCEELLERFGSPCGWLDTCQSCRNILRDARKIHREISLLSQELERRKRKVKQKIICEGQDFIRTQEKESAVLIRHCFLQKCSESYSAEPVKTETMYPFNEDYDQEGLDMAFDEQRLDGEDERVVTDESDQEWNSPRPSPVRIPGKPRKIRKERKHDGMTLSNPTTSDVIEVIKCPHCVLSNFSDKYKLIAHLRTTHWIYQKATSLKRKCRKCKIVLKIDALRKHCLETHGMQQCSKCPAVLDNRSSLRQHLLRLHKVRLKYNVHVANPISPPVKTEASESFKAESDGPNKVELFIEDVDDGQEDQGQDDDFDLTCDEQMLEDENERVVTDEKDEEWDSHPRLDEKPVKFRKKKLDKTTKSDQTPVANEALKCPCCVLSNFSDHCKLTSHLRMTHWIYQKATSLKRKCTKCKIVLKIDALRKHCLETHGMQQCSRCPAVLDNRCSLRKHLLRLHKVHLKRDVSETIRPPVKVEIHRCPHCNYCSYTKILLRRHLETFHPDKSLPRPDENDSTTSSSLACDKCPLSEPNRFYSSYNELNDHKAQAHNMFRCYQCCYVCLGPGYLHTHQEAYHDESNANADPSIFRRGRPAMNLGKTRVREENNSHLKCRLCTQLFETRDQLTQHRFDEHPEELFSCEKCDRKFDKMGLLYAHRTEDHGESDNPYRCPDCNYTNHSYPHLHKHRLIVHTGRPKVVCEICSASFATERYLFHHKTRKHGAPADKSDLICSYCGKTFANPTYLKVHTRTAHLGQSRHKCPRPGCGMGFNGQKQLKIHVMQVHDKIFPFPCTEPGCQVKYATKLLLTYHMKCAHGPKLFKCSQCDYAAGVSGRVKQHEAVVHNKTGSFQCDHCGNVYTSRKSYVQHLRLTHKMPLGKKRKEASQSHAVDGMKSESKQGFPIGEKTK